jgi:hypothetical protein
MSPSKGEVVVSEQSKKERRDDAREARRLAEQEAAAAATKARVRSIAITVVSLVAIGALVALAFDNVRTTSIDSALVVSRTAAAEAFDANGCEVLVTDTPESVEAEHVDPATAPPADVMYPFQVRPAHSGPHFVQTLPIIRSGVSSQLEERALTHNLEHGAIAIWYDPAQVSSDDIGVMETLSETLNDNGFANSRGGGGIFVSPYTEPGISSGKAVALRAWGNAVDCNTWNEDVAKSFTRENYGTEGIGPEGNFSPYPFATLQYDDEVPESATDEPSDASDMPTDAATTSDAPSEAASEPTASDEPTASEAPTDASTAEATEPTS